MNSLNLRVSAVKSGENVKKNAEIRASLVTLPLRFAAANEYYCVEFKHAKSISEQVTVVKNIFKNLISDAQALQFLGDLYFHCPLKHPVRNQILKLLITAARLGTGSIDEISIVTVLTQSIQELIQQSKTEIESSAWNVIVTSLSGCFENFKCGLCALEQCTDVVLPFLYNSQQKYLTELSVLSSPSVRNEYYLYVHNSTRLILSCVQEFGHKLVSTHVDVLKQLKVIGRQIILDDEIPMDPRTNAGILLAHIAKLFEEYDTFIQDVKLAKQSNEIALCVGVVNTFDQHDFHLLSADIRDICSKIEEIANDYATIPNILLCAARALYQYSKIILSFELKTQNTMDDAKLILRKLLIFTFGYLEHHMDSVRHICRDLLRNIVAAANQIRFDFLLQKIYDACNSERLSLSMKCVVLQQSATILGADAIISNNPMLFSSLFAEHLGRDFLVNNLFEALMSASHKELSYDAWFKLWIQYLLDIAHESDERLPDIEILIVKAVKCEAKLVEYIIEQTKSEIPSSTKLSALWAVRKTGIKLENFNEIMQKFSKCLLLSIICNCDETRIMALRLLVETHKTTEPLSSLECEHLLTYLEYNANAQSPATRQKTIALLGKALVRCELNLLKEQKQQTNATTTSDEENKSTCSVLTPSTASKLQMKTDAESLHHKFLINFMRILVENLFLGANFSRRSVSLQLLQQALRICINCNYNLPQMLPPHTIINLAATLRDSYETNKELAVSILKMLEDEMNLSLIKVHNLPIRLSDMQQLLTSVRPLDSVTAAFQLDFYCNRALSDVFGSYELPIYSATYFAAIRWLLLQLRDGLQLAKQSILQAAKLNPLYGLLYAVRHLLQRLDFRTLAQDITWRILIAELVVLCKELTTIVAPIVNSSSPEGHLPNDFSDLSREFAAQFNIELENEEQEQRQKQKQQQKQPEKTASKEGTLKKCNILSVAHKIRAPHELQNLKTTPQMVLLCAWRTVKEVSLMLGDIVLRAPLQLSKLTAQFLLTKEQVLEIGEHFKQLLAETKHRGAFEQAYVGFAKLCCRLWRVEALDLNSLPMQWLRELVTAITKASQPEAHGADKMCATRRSAGVPFMAQALITAELQVGTTKSLYFCITALLQLCASTSSSSSSSAAVESRTHALNILRALFRCTDLNEAVGEFVGDGVMCAIRAYDADNWSERNSATLLFAALITRIFGVQRTKDTEHLNIRNKMTGRVFFLRYPKLYDFFLEQLSTASVLVRAQQHANKLHPLLLILSRLYPSALEGTESNLKLSAFIPYISDCSGCAEMQTRYLTAKAFVALISRDMVVSTILHKCAEIMILPVRNSDINLNHLHGQLLQILLLVKSLSHHSEDLMGDLSCTLVTFHERTQMKNAVILKAMLDIFIELMQRKSSLNVPQTTLQNLLSFTIQKDFRKTHLSHYYAVLRKSYFIYNLHTLRLTLPFGALSDYLLNPPVIHETVQLEEAETCLNVILLILLNCISNCSPSPNAAAATQTSAPTVDILDIAEFEIPPQEMQFVRVLQEETLKELSAELRKSKTLHHTLKEVIQRPLYYPACAMKAFAILSFLDNFDFTLGQLMKDAKDQTSDIKIQLTMCVERFMLKRKLDFKTAQTCLEYLMDLAQPWQPDGLRWKATKILIQIASHYPIALEKKKLTFVRPYMNLMLTLLMDDDIDVRHSTAKIVLNNLPDDIEIDNVVSTMAQRLFLQYTADILLANKADDSYILDIFKVIVDVMTVPTPLEDNSNSASSACSQIRALDLEIFDKNEANVFAEPQKAIRDAIVVFKNTFRMHTKVFNFVSSFKV